jgi:hypothetical protein
MKSLRGRLVQDKTTKQPKLNIRNWECGVVVTIPKPNLASTEGVLGKEAGEEGNYSRLNGSAARPLGMNIFEGHVSVPMVVPGDEYGIQRPWFYMER